MVGGQRLAWAAVAAAVAALSAAPAFATQVVLRSRAPYWEVGIRDPTLGQLCSTGRFNQIEIERYVARFYGQTGPGVLGIAKGTGLNLRDPGHNAVPTEDYFFLGDGTSSCTVYVGGRKPKQQNAAQTAKKPVGPNQNQAKIADPVVATPATPTPPAPTAQAATPAQ